MKLTASVFSLYAADSNLRQKKCCAIGIWWAGRIIEIFKTSIEELFLSTENAYPHAERAFRKCYWNWKAAGAIPITWESSAGPQGVAATCCMHTGTEGRSRGSCSVGHQVRSINIRWASAIFSSLTAWVKPKGKLAKFDDSGPQRFLAIKPTNQALSHTQRGQICPAAPEWVPWAGQPQWKARIPRVCSSGK